MQNRQSSQKLRNNNKSQIEELSEKVKDLVEENDHLRHENNELKDQNAYLVKKCSFYERTLKASLQQNEENDEDQDITIVCDQKDDIYHRVESPRDKQKFVKNFLCLTIFTVLLQLIDVDFQSDNSSSGIGQMKLKSLDIGQISHDFFTKIIAALPTAVFFTKNLLLIIWIVVLVFNYKKMIK